MEQVHLITCSIRMEQNTDEVFTLTNNGNVAAIINTVTIVGPGPFTINAEDCTTNSPILPAGTCDVTVRFSPLITGAYVGDVFRVNYDDGTLVAPVNADYGVEGNSAVPAILSSDRTSNW